MRHKQLLFPSISGRRDLCGQLWLPDGPPRCLVQLIPEVGEAADYRALAAYLLSQGAGLAVHDHLSGSVSAAYNGLTSGCLPPHYGWKQLLADCQGFTRQLRAYCPRVPLLLWGQGGGAWLAACLLEEDSWPYAAALLAAAPDPGPGVRLASLCAAGAELRRGGAEHSAWLQRCVQALARGRFQSRRGAVYWLLHGDVQPAVPLSLSLCRAVLTCASQGRGHSARLRADLPLLLAAGGADGRTDAGFRRGYRRLCDQGLERVELYLFREQGPKLLERGEDEVWDALWQWSERQLKHSRQVQVCLQTI